MTESNSLLDNHDIQEGPASTQAADAPLPDLSALSVPEKEAFARRLLVYLSADASEEQVAGAYAALEVRVTKALGGHYDPDAARIRGLHQRRALVLENEDDLTQAAAREAFKQDLWNYLTGVGDDGPDEGTLGNIKDLSDETS